MRRLLAFLFFSTAAFAQNPQRSSYAVQNNAGYQKNVAHAAVTLCAYNAQLQCNSPVTIFSDPALTAPIAYPFYADGNGYFSYYNLAGTYVERQCAPASTCTFFQITLSGGSGGVKEIIPGTNITCSTELSGSCTGNVTINASGGGSSCGSLSGDNTSTDCGFNNRVGDTAAIPANVSTYGTLNGATNAATEVVAEGDSNVQGLTNSSGDIVGIGDSNLSSEDGITATQVVAIGYANATAAGTPLTDVVAVGDDNASTITRNADSDLVCVGHLNCSSNNGNNFGTDIVGIGDNSSTRLGQAHNVVGVGDGDSSVIALNSSDLVGVGDASVSNVETASTNLVGVGNFDVAQTSGADIVGVGDTSAEADFGQNIIGVGDTSATNVFYGVNVIGVGNSSAENIGLDSDVSPSQDIIGIGDGSASHIGSVSDDVIGIGQGSASHLGAASSDVVAIGDGAASNGDASLTDVVAVGNGAGNTEKGAEFVGIGTNAGACNDANEIIAVGDHALGGLFTTSCTPAQITGHDLIAIGHLALAANTSGTDNIAIGKSAGANGYTSESSVGDSNQTGIQNVWIGDGSGPNTTNQLSNTIAIGFQAHNTVSNQTVIGNVSTTSLIIFGATDGCLSSTSGAFSGSGAGCTPPPATTLTCNSNGCYRIEADGTIEEWGADGAGCGSGGSCTTAITFPHAFTSASHLSVQATLSVGNSSWQTSATGQVTTGFNLMYAPLVYVGGSGVNLDGSERATWFAIGN